MGLIKLKDKTVLQLSDQPTPAQREELSLISGKIQGCMHFSREKNEGRSSGSWGVRACIEWHVRLSRVESTHIRWS